MRRGVEQGHRRGLAGEGTREREEGDGPEVSTKVSSGGVSKGA